MLALAVLFVCVHVCIIIESSTRRSKETEKGDRERRQREETEREREERKVTKAREGRQEEEG